VRQLERGKKKGKDLRPTYLGLLPDRRPSSWGLGDKWYTAGLVGNGLLFKNHAMSAGSVSCGENEEKTDASEMVAASRVAPGMRPQVWLASCTSRARVGRVQNRGGQGNGHEGRPNDERAARLNKAGSTYRPGTYNRDGGSGGGSASGERDGGWCVRGKGKE
jgi:hypothetical protein